VLENARLIAELRASRQRLVAAQDAERRRIERDLHDGAQQRLVALGIELRRARQRLGQLDPCHVGELLDRSAGDVQAAVDELRELARGIHPAVLTTGGLGPALQSLADRSPVPVVTRLDVDGAAPATVAATAYFVTAEALANAARHAHASQVELSGAVHGGWLVVSIRDDGQGGATSVPGGGLQGLADRVAAVGGTLAVDSPVGAGTTIRMEVPCGSS
jgi:signal transduction histidine kinase